MRLLKGLLSALVCLAAVGTAQAQYEVAAPSTPVSQMEKLNRGLVVFKDGQTNATGNFISWRLLGTDDFKHTTFNLYKNGTLLAGNIGNVTCYTDPEGTDTDKYTVETVVNGDVTETTEEVVSWGDYVKRIHLQKPDASVNNNSSDYSPNDCSVGDVDGDGEYELFVKWDPADSQDNSKSGKTSNVIIDCYKLDGTRLWSVNLGPNIRAGAHYTQFLVYDFDGDGKAEMICKTAPWSKDGKGNFVSKAADDSEITGTDNSKSYRNSKGYVLDGPEYLTVFEGLTGKAIHTVFYNPNRAGTLGGAPSGSDKSFWGDNYGGRCDRFLASVAYLDGPDSHPSAIMCRGYYTRAYVWAVDFDGSKLSTKWLHGSISQTSVQLTDATGKKTTKTYSKNTCGNGARYTAYGNGNHNMSVADVDGDGCDEIIYGSCAIDNDGNLLYSTGFGHGDAMHVSDLIPSRPGLEVFEVHEEKTGTLEYGWDLHDAATGEIIRSDVGASDNGRGMSADVVDVPGVPGFEYWSSNNRQQLCAENGQVANEKSVSVNFRIYWDGDLLDELLDGASISKVKVGTGALVQSIAGKPVSTYGVSSCNSTKATPNLSADIFGDWREEVILWDKNTKEDLIVFSSSVPTQFRVPTLMHDHVYRMGITWQQTAYNQPPHLGYYLPNYVHRFADITGDINIDGDMNTTDVTNLYNVIFGTDTVTPKERCNIDGSEDIDPNTSDVTALYNIIFGTTE